MGLTPSKFQRWNSFPDFFLYACRYCADFWHVSQSAAFLKTMHTKTEHSLYLKGCSNTFFYFENDIIPPGIHTAGKGLGIAMQYFQNAC